MQSYTLQGNPLPKLRPRFTKNGRAFNCQKREGNTARVQFLQQMGEQRILRRYDGPISVSMGFYTPIPVSWSHKRQECANGQPDPTRPDIDNYVKFPLDVMNQLIFNDDNLVTELHCVKKYSNVPRTEITVCEHKVDGMAKEHVLTIKGVENDLNVEDLNYIVRKANRLGLVNREVHRVFYEEDSEGWHVFFECDGPGKLKN